MIPAADVIGIDVSRDWLDGFCASSGRHFRLPNTAEGHGQFLVQIRDFPGAVRIGFEATGGQEWALWVSFVAAGIEAVQLAPAQIKAFARSRPAREDRPDRRGAYSLLSRIPYANRVNFGLPRALDGYSF